MQEAFSAAAVQRQAQVFIVYKGRLTRAGRTRKTVLGGNQVETGVAVTPCPVSAPIWVQAPPSVTAKRCDADKRAHNDTQPPTRAHTHTH